MSEKTCEAKRGTKLCALALAGALAMSGAAVAAAPAVDLATGGESHAAHAATAKAKISASKKTLHKGATCTLKMKNAGKSKVTWTSSNAKVAAVSKNGKVTAKKAGTATIKAKVAGKTYKCKVTVEAKKHTWTPVKKKVTTIKKVLVSEAWDEIVPGKEMIVCGCGETFDTLEEYVETHHKPAMMTKDPAIFGPHVNYGTTYGPSTVINHPATYQNKSVTETKTVGYKCTCGAKK